MHAAARRPIFEYPITSAPARVAAAVLFAAAPVAVAGPGDLDVSFGEQGRAFVDFPNDTDVAATVILQADGKLVIGRENVAEADDFSVLRLNPDGSPDMSFGQEGRTTLDFQGIKGTTHVVLQQSDGSIVAAGTAQSTWGPDDADFGMARYNSDGSVDTGFGVDGVVLHNLGGQRDGINAIVQQVDGRLIAAGYTEGSGGPSNSDMAFARFNADGSLDTSFGANGSLIINFHGGNGPDEAGWLIQQPDGKLLAVGTAWPSNPSSSTDIGVVRLTPDGIPDTTFDGDGRAAVELDVSRNWGSHFLEAAGIALQPDGRILVAGLTGHTVWDYGFCLPVIARLNADGSLDPSFGESGSVPIAIDGSCATFDELAIDPSGDVFAAGGAFHAYTGDLFVARVSASGDLDRSFGAAGVAIVDLGRARHVSSFWYGSGGIVHQPDGRIVAVASTATSDWASGGDPQLVVARLLADGNHPGVLGFRGDSWEFEGRLQVESETVGVAEIPVRRTGGSFGAVTIDYETRSGRATSGVDFTGTAGMLTWADGDRTDRIISVSITDDAEIEEPESFSLILSNPSGGATLATTEMSLLIESDESPSTEPPPTSPPTGAPGTGGGSGAIGWELLIAPALLLLHPRALKTRRGRTRREPGNAELTVHTKTRGAATAALLMAAAVAFGNPGDLDVTFGTGGRVSLDLGSGQGMTFAAVQQFDGRIVLAGNLFSTRQPVLIRFETNGTLDSSFGDGGIVTGAQRDDTAGAVIQQADGKLVVAGIAFLDQYYAALWRFDSDGSIDTTFGTDGAVTLELGNIHIWNVAGLVQQSDGKLVIAGTAAASSEVYMVLARFHANGSLDTSFGSGGTAIIDFADTDVGVSPASLILQPDGKLVTSGRQGQSVAVARVTAAGALDETFGESGRLVISIETETDPYSWATSAAVQDDGKLVIAGAIGREHPWELDIVATDGFILRLQTDGVLDPTFGASGLVTGRQIQAAEFVAVAVQADGRIVAAVSCRWFDSGCDMALVRLNPDGSSDSTFGIGGVSVADFGTLDRPPLSLVDAMIHQSDGNFLIVGSHAVPNSDFPWMLAMARFGRDDTGFPGLIGFTSARKDVNENAGGVEFSVRRTGGSAGAVSATFHTTGESATAGSDYVPRSGRLDWADGDSSTKVITLTLIDDAESEATGESFRLTLSDPSGGAMLTVSEATIAIADVESPPLPAPVPPPVESGGGAGSSDWLWLVLFGPGALSARAAIALLLRGAGSRGTRADGADKPFGQPGQPALRRASPECHPRRRSVNLRASSRDISCYTPRPSGAAGGYRRISLQR